MRTFETLDYTESGEIAEIVLNRPRMNMLMVRELTAVCDHLEDSSDCKVAVFRGRDGVFSEGIDFEDFRPDQGMDIHGFNKWEKLCVRIERLPKVTVAAIDGVVRGGGVQLALVCDSRIATEGSTLQLDEVHQGFLPGMATFRLAKYIGLGNAKRLIMQCPVIDAEEACALGILDEVCDDLDVAVGATIAAFGPIHTVSVALARRLLNESFAAPFEHAIGNFLAAQHRAITQSAFLETIANARDTTE
jgi:enoyl-CoA hydratase/carnithine racemase